MDTFYLTASDGVEVFVRSWCVEAPKGVMQIVHGMNEHSGRYAEFAEFLNDWGYDVYATDHRGHGQTVGDPQKVGYIGENGFTLMVEDEEMLRQFIGEKYNHQIPQYILGHSMGSFIIQRFIQIYGDGLAGVILMGSCGYNNMAKMGRHVAKMIEKKNNDERSTFLEKVVMSSYNKKTKKETPYDWLASDPQVMKNFMADPYCAKVFPPSFYRQLLQWLVDIFDKDEIARIPKKLPLLLVAGTQDPVGLYGRGMLSLHIQYKNHGTEDLDMYLYEDSRHEVLNDVEKKQVMDDILTWLHQHP